jgi:hypothetical protein
MAACRSIRSEFRWGCRLDSVCRCFRSSCCSRSTSCSHLSCLLNQTSLPSHHLSCLNFQFRRILHHAICHCSIRHWLSRSFQSCPPVETPWQASPRRPARSKCTPQARRLSRPLRGNARDSCAEWYQLARSAQGFRFLLKAIELGARPCAPQCGLAKVRLGTRQLRRCFLQTAIAPAPVAQPAQTD